MTSGPTDMPTAQRAIACLEELALEQGLDHVSMRDVAKRVGISLAALQYHYPNKAALIDAFVSHTIEHHRRQLVDRFPTGGARLADAVRYALAENLAGTAAGLLEMVYARALHDKATAASLRRFQRVYLEVLRDLVIAEQPDMSADDALVAATLIVALVEGLSDTHASAVDLGADPSRITQTAIALATQTPALVAS